MNACKFKICLLSGLLLVLINGCVNDTTTNSNEAIDTLGAQKQEMETPAMQLPYEVEYDEVSGEFSIVENPDTLMSAINAQMLIDALEKKYPEIAVRVGDKRNDTLEVYIDDATYLTQNIGTAGANAYMAEATFAFTSLDSITTINFVFEAGDHASPGAYQRKDYDDFQ